jgi:uncharacterized protein
MRWTFSLKWALLCLALCFGVVAHAQELQKIPQLKSPVTDLSGTLSAEQRAALTQTLLDFEHQHGSQIAVLLVPTTAPETIDQYSIRVVDQNKIGRADIDDGVLVLVAMRDAHIRIEVGRGLEGAIPDVYADRIRREIMNPKFRAGDFYGGLNDGVQALMKLIAGEALPLPAQAPHRGAKGQSFESLFVVLLMFTIIGGGVLRALLGGRPGAAATGGIVGTIAWLIAGTLLGALAAGVLGFLFAMAGGSSGGRRVWPIGIGGGFGGGGLGGGGGGFGGGGWSGGGGGFSGGGASGSWN